MQRASEPSSVINFLMTFLAVFRYSRARAHNNAGDMCELARMWLGFSFRTRAFCHRAFILWFVTNITVASHQCIFLSKVLRAWMLYSGDLDKLIAITHSHPLFDLVCIQAKESIATVYKHIPVAPVKLLEKLVSSTCSTAFANNPSHVSLSLSHTYIHTAA